MFGNKLSIKDSSIESIQSKSITFLSYFNVSQILCVALAAYATDNDIVLYSSFSALLAFAGLIISRSKNKALVSNVIAVSLMGQVCLILAASTGHPYQIDLHLYFFAILGMIAGMFYCTPIIMATLLVAIHHLVLYIFFPLYVFPSDSSLFRVIIHAVILLCEAGVLLWVIALIKTSFANTSYKKQQAEIALEKANQLEKERLVERSRQEQEQQQLLKQQERRIMDDVCEIITACSQGDFSQRINVEDKDGISLFLANGMNEICDITFSSISDIRQSISELSSGKLDVKIDRQYQGIFNDIKDDFNNTVDQLESLILDVNKSVSMAIQGNFSHTIDTSNSEGFMLDLAKGMNDICKISHQGLNEIKNSISALSQGDLNKGIEGDYNGEFLEIKTSFNDTLRQLSIIINDIKYSARQISTGDFSNKINTEDKKGFLLELAIGINSINTVLDKGLGEFQTSIEELSKGNLSHPIEGIYIGKFDEIRNAVNGTLSQLTTVTDEIKASANAISEGDFSKRLSVTNKEGFLLDLSQSINEISEISSTGLNEIGTVLNALSHGNLNKKIINEYEGTFHEIKEVTNNTITNLKTVVGEIQDAANAVKNGDFTVRIDTSEKEGFLLGLSESLNEIGETSSQGLNEIEEVLLHLSTGSLVHHMDGDCKGTFNDIKNTLNSTITQLHNMVLQIIEAANSVNDASSEISEGSVDLSRRTEVQASALEETTAATEQLKSIVKINTESAEDANSKAGEARNIATSGDKIISNTVDAMSRIQESSSKVTEIISVIDEIAFQTNLLALNAAVEAARAGETGKGFAVVASEVRSLAGRSAAASKEIKELINLSVGEVQTGSSLVKESGTTLNNIIESVNVVADLIDQIAKAGKCQSEGINEVSQAITEMDETTQQNAALVQQSTASSRSMNEQAEILLELTNFFKVDKTAV